MTRLVLASASPGRLAVLRGAGVEPLVLVSGVDEDAVVAGLAPTAPPDEVVCALAAAKADAVLELLADDMAADCVVVGCDSMLDFGGRLCGKPESASTAETQWQSMGGRSGRLHTGHCAIRLKDNVIVDRLCESAVTAVRFAAPSAADLAAYLASGEPLQVAGGFTLDGLGGWFVDGIDGDPSNVIGLSLPLLRRMLAQVGLSIATLWAANPTEK